MSRFHPPDESPRIAHLPLESPLTSGPPLPPLRSAIFAFGTGFPVVLSTTRPARRLLPRQSSPANSVAARQRTAAASANVFFKINLLRFGTVRSCRLSKKKPPGEIPPAA